MRMEKRKFRIGELAKKLGVERFVIRFWEKEFNLKTFRSDGQQRFYSQEDLTLFGQIKELLYTKGFTIVGAKQQLRTHKKEAPIIGSTKLASFQDKDEKDQQISLLNSQIAILKEKLVKLSQLLQK